MNIVDPALASQGPSVPSGTSPEVTSIWRLCRYFRAATAHLRTLFLNFWVACSPSSEPWTDEPAQRSLLVSLVKTKISRSFMLKTIKKEPIEAWDLSIWPPVLISLHLLFSQPLAAIIDFSLLEKSISTLISARNDFSHARDSTGAAYQQLLEKVSSALVGLGIDISSIASSPAPVLDADPMAIESQVMQLKGKGNEAFENKQYSLAVECYSSALALSGLSDDVRGVLYSNRSASYYYTQEYKKAQDDAKKSSNLIPGWWKPLYWLGASYNARGCYQKALMRLYESECNAPSAWTQRLNHEIWLARYELGRVKRGEQFVTEMIPPSPDEALEKTGRRLPMTAAQMRQGNRKIAPLVALNGDAHQAVADMQYEKAYKLFLQAANGGSAEGMYNVGLSLMRGQGVTRDFAEAKRWLQKASVVRTFDMPEDLRKWAKLHLSDPRMCCAMESPLGVGEALHLLGLAASEGVFGPVDHVLAADYYRQAGQFNSPNSLHNLALMYQSGTGVPYDPRKAIQLLQEASNHPSNHTPPMFSLAIAYLSGNGLTPPRPDEDQARYWLQKASTHGNHHATSLLQTLNEQRREATNFHASPPLGSSTRVPAATPSSHSRSFVRKAGPSNSSSKSSKGSQHTVSDSPPSSFPSEAAIFEKLSNIMHRPSRHPSRHISFGTKIQTKALMEKFFEQLERTGSLTARRVEFSAYLSMISMQNLLRRHMSREDRKMVLALAASTLRIDETPSLLPDLQDLVDQSLKENPKDRDALLILMAMRMGNTNEQLLLFLTKCINYHPKDARFWAARGRVHGFRGEWKLALPDLDKALAITPNEAGFLYSRWYILTQLEPKDMSKITEAGHRFFTYAEPDMRHLLQLGYDMAMHLFPDDPGLAERYYKLGQQLDRCSLAFFEEEPLKSKDFLSLLIPESHLKAVSPVERLSPPQLPWHPSPPLLDDAQLQALDIDHLQQYLLREDQDNEVSRQAFTEDLTKLCTLASESIPARILLTAENLCRTVDDSVKNKSLSPKEALMRLADAISLADTLAPMPPCTMSLINAVEAEEPYNKEMMVLKVHMLFMEQQSRLKLSPNPSGAFVDHNVYEALIYHPLTAPLLCISATYLLISGTRLVSAVYDLNRALEVEPENAWAHTLKLSALFCMWSAPLTRTTSKDTKVDGKSRDILSEELDKTITKGLDALPKDHPARLTALAIAIVLRFSVLSPHAKFTEDAAMASLMASYRQCRMLLARYPCWFVKWHWSKAGQFAALQDSHARAFADDLLDAFFGRDLLPLY